MKFSSIFLKSGVLCDMFSSVTAFEASLLIQWKLPKYCTLLGSCWRFQNIKIQRCCEYFAIGSNNLLCFFWNVCISLDLNCINTSTIKLPNCSLQDDIVAVRSAGAYAEIAGRTSSELDFAPDNVPIARKPVTSGWVRWKMTSGFGVKMKWDIGEVIQL